MLVQHLEPLRGVLIRERFACAFERFATTITRPCPKELSAPQLQRRRVENWRCFADAIALRDVHRVSVAIPDQLHGTEGMVPTKVHSTNARPLVGKVSL